MKYHNNGVREIAFLYLTPKRAYTRVRAGLKEYKSVFKKNFK